MYQELWDDIFNTLKDKGGEVCIGYVNEREPAESNYDELVAHLERLDKHKITERLLVCEGDNYFVQDISCYRWLPYNVFKAGSLFFVYGTKVAMQFWNGKTTVIIDNKNLAKAEQERFEYLWNISKIPT